MDKDLVLLQSHIKKIFTLIEEALEQDEVPASALTFQEDNILSANYNLTKTKKNPLAHSEIICIEETAKLMHSERLNNINLLCSLEPCLMCLGAISQARIKTVYYLCRSESGVGLCDLPAIAKTYGRNKGLNHVPNIIFIPDYEQKIKTTMKNYFASKRKQK